MVVLKCAIVGAVCFILGTVYGIILSTVMRKCKDSTPDSKTNTMQGKPPKQNAYATQAPDND